MLSFRLLQATIVNASTFGYTTTNATAAFQNAIQSSFDTIVFDLQSADWNVNPNLFFDLSNKTLIFEKGVVLRAIPGAFNGTGDCLLKLVRASNITIIGYGAEFVMNKPEYVILNDSEYRHCLHIDNSSGITVKGLTIRDSGGDGIYAGGATWWGPQTYSENILLEDVRCINNYRQGMSICSVQNMLVRHCLFTQTGGTLPEAGVDIEPFEAYQRVVNLNFEHCSFTNNNHSGIVVALFEMDSTSLPVSIRFSDCYLSNNHVPSNVYVACEIELSANDTMPVQGSVIFDRCLIENSQWSAFYSRKTSEAYLVEFHDCAFVNVSQQQVQYNEPIFMEVPSYTLPSAALGGYVFDDVLITYTTNFDFFRVYGWSTLAGIADMSGNFTVAEPNGNGVLYQQVPDTTNVTFTWSTQPQLPATTVQLNEATNIAEECTATAATFTASRTSSNLLWPLPVRYDTSGAVSWGDDVHLLTGSLIIRAGQTTATDSVFARYDSLSEPAEPVKLALRPTGIPLYTYTPADSALMNAVDCLSSSTSETVQPTGFAISPNPASDQILLLLPQGVQPVPVSIYDAAGR
ncbi:MAG: right-handed parallel beta-helix repeat-containing protein, partial [Bacteroidia bacterium]